MARRPPYRRSRFAAMPRWGWVVVAIVIAAGAFVVIRHVRSHNDAAVLPSDRARLLRQAQSHLRGDPTVADVVYSPADEQWDVTPAIAGVDAKAFGRYVCFTLGEAGIVDPETSVRVIDAAKLKANAFNYAAASRGTFTCEVSEE